MWMTLVTTVSKAIGDTTKSIFNYFSTVKEKQSETEIIKDKKDYKKATNIAEKIIDIAQQYKADMTFAHRLKFVRLVQAFKKYN